MPTDATNPGRDQAAQQTAAALAAPFDPSEVKWKAQTVKANRALAVAYVDARVIQDRLDDVLGVENWQDTYRLLPDGSVVCRLRLFIGGRWIRKTDVGSPSEQPDGGDRLKAAFSDALKRAAVKFGLGRYLYRLAAQWVDYDPVRKQFASTPQLPAFALPAGAKASSGRGAKPAPAKTAAKPSRTLAEECGDLMAKLAEVKGVDYGQALAATLKHLKIADVPGLDDLTEADLILVRDQLVEWDRDVKPKAKASA